METFGTLKRRTTDLVNNISVPKPAMPAMPTELPKVPQVSFPSLSGLSSHLPKMPAWAQSSSPSQQQQQQQPTTRATWERIDVPSIPRSSHSINVVSGSAYIFGGEVEPRQPVDNDMHVIVLPYSSAGADCYTIKAKTAPRPQIPTVVEPPAATSSSVQGGDKEKELSDVPLSEDQVQEDPTAASSSSSSKPAIRAGDNSLGDVPSPRVGHATAVIGNRIFLFGGRGGADMDTPLEEQGRVWVFDTKTHLWSHLDPYIPSSAAAAADAEEPTSFADKRQFFPAARSYHSAAALDLPRDFGDGQQQQQQQQQQHHYSGSGVGPAGPGGRGRLKRTSTWTEWAQGDSEMVGTPQRPIVGNVANNSRDEDEDGYGTFIVHGGCLAADKGGRVNDTWAFDVRSRVWHELPSAPGRSRGGTGLTVAGGKLWRFGGFNGEGEEGGQLDYLELGVDNDVHDHSGGPEVILSARGGGWKSIFPNQVPSAAATNPAASEDDEAASSQPLAQQQHPSQVPSWPGHRSVAGLQTVTIGGPSGREYLLLTLGERDPSSQGHEAAGKFWSDTWAYELPHPTAAGQVIGMAQGGLDAWLGRGRSGSHSSSVEGKWFRVEAEAYDDEDEVAAQGPGPRGWFASAHMGELEERGVVIWGGVDETNKRLGDGWILRIGAEKREP